MPTKRSSTSTKPATPAPAATPRRTTATAAADTATGPQIVKGPEPTGRMQVLRSTPPADTGSRRSTPDTREA